MGALNHHEHAHIYQIGKYDWLERGSVSFGTLGQKYCQACPKETWRVRDSEWAVVFKGI